MFSKKDFTLIDERYFQVIHKSSNHIILKSSKTEHIWTIYSKDHSLKLRSIEVWDQHHEYDQPHIQPRFHPKSVGAAQMLIKEHDKYILDKERS